jgi:hypothetical protein
LRLFLSAALAALLLSGTAFAAPSTLTDDEILSDLVVVTAAPRPADVKMAVQTAKSSPAADRQAKAEAPAEEAPQPVKTASK